MKNADDPRLNLNVRLIRKIQRAIVKWPKNYDQSNFGDKESWTQFGFNAKKQKEPTCGSACCIAGWACALEGKPPAKLKDAAEPARKLLGLTYDQSEKLFAGMFSATPACAVKALDRLIKTGGRKSWVRR